MAGTFDDPFFFDLDGFRNGFQFTGIDFFAGLNVYRDRRRGAQRSVG